MIITLASFGHYLIFYSLNGVRTSTNIIILLLSMFLVLIKSDKVTISFVPKSDKDKIFITITLSLKIKNRITLKQRR